jgi:hypothetical protein
MSFTLAALLLAAPQMITGAPPTARALPATEWSCTLEGEGGARFRIGGRIDAIPAGWDPNRSRPTELNGEGHPALSGKASVTAGDWSRDLRDYQIGTMHAGETYYINLKLRRGGAGVAYVTRYVPKQPPEPVSYIAAGLCTSQFDVAAKGAGQ